MKYFSSFFLIVLTSITLHSQESKGVTDSIYVYRNLSDNKDLSILERIKYARKAISLSRFKEIDSTILESNRKLSFLFLINQDYDSIYRINKENLKLSRKLNDTLKMGFASQNLGFYFNLNNINDSAYYYYFNATKFYKISKTPMYEVDVLRNMSIIQTNAGDFLGAEVNAINAIKILEKLPNSLEKYENLWSLNNSIANISKQLNNFEKSIEYHTKALSFAKKINDDNSSELFSKINIGILNREKGDYIVAKDVFLDLLKDKSLKLADPDSYTTIISNLGYTKFLNGEEDLQNQKEMFWEALKISLKEENLIEEVSNYEYLSELYKNTEVKDSALFYADNMYNKAKELNDTQSILNALVLKSKLEKGDSSKKHLYEHIKLSDSLIQAERIISNKFARIEFETDEIKQENIQISKQNLWLVITSIGLLVTLFFLYIIKSQREKNKELQLERQQQEANQEIYNLLLTQQDKIDEVRSLEKNRISKDIHDGVLGKLFGVRLSLDGLNLSTAPDAVEKRSNYINELKNIEEEIRKVSHELNSDFIHQSGYLDIVQTLVDTQMTAYGIDYNFNVDPNINWELLNNKIKIHLYRILQETMQNTYKHAKANKVEVSFNLDNNDLILNVSDNGIGFDLQKAKKGIGLKNIDSRIQEINGNLAIDTTKAQGTTIKINVPAFNK